MSVVLMRILNTVYSLAVILFTLLYTALPKLDTTLWSLFYNYLGGI